MTKEEYYKLPVGTKFLMRANRYCELNVWEFLTDNIKGDEELYRRNCEYAKNNLWHKILRRMRNIDNGHECWLSAQVYNEFTPQKERYWNTRNMHLIK